MMIDCKLLLNTKEHMFRAHASQAIAGFLALEKQKRISLKIDFNSRVHIQPSNTFCCIINNKKVFYDIEDGIENLTPDFLDYVHCHKCFLFKRAYDERLYKNDPLILPYGLNYFKMTNSFLERVAFHFVKRGVLSPRLNRLTLSKIKEWSMIDNKCKYNNGILFCTRLWSQKDTHTPVDRLNETRIQTVISLRKSFPKNTIAGIVDSPLSRKMCKSLILSHRITNRNRFLDLIRKSCVCVTTTGLYRSIGWRFGEFVASGKSIVSEPLFFSVPGDFHEGKNYLTFSSATELAERCDYLLSNYDIRREMELNNINYYFHNLRPDALVWNSIKQVC